MRYELPGIVSRIFVFSIYRNDNTVKINPPIIKKIETTINIGTAFLARPYTLIKKKIPFTAKNKHTIDVKSNNTAGTM